MTDAGRGVLIELRRDGPRRWDVSRPRCAIFAVGIPLGLVAVTALVLASLLSPVDTGDGSGLGFGFAIVGAMVLILSVLAVREYVLLMLFGGGLAATPEALEFRWGRRTMLFPWSIVQGAAVESRSSGRGSYDILALRFRGTGYRWPRAFSLWFSEPTCLCISPLVMARPARLIATELAAAVAQLAVSGGDAGMITGRRGGPAAYAEPLSRADLHRDRVIKGGLGAAGSFLVAAFSVAVAVSAVDDPELSVGGSLLVAVIMSVVGVGSLAYARGGGRG